MQFLHELCKVIIYWWNNRPVCFISPILRKRIQFYVVKLSQRFHL